MIQSFVAWRIGFFPTKNEDEVERAPDPIPGLCIKLSCVLTNYNRQVQVTGKPGPKIYDKYNSIYIISWEHVTKWIGRWRRFPNTSTHDQQWESNSRSEGLEFDSHCWSCVDVLGKLLIPYCLSPPRSNGYLVERKIGKL